MKIKKLDNIGWLAIGVAVIVSAGFLGFFSRHQLINVYMELRSHIQPGYKSDRALVYPYFDEEFYRQQYKHELAQTHQEPIDHFMQRSCVLGGGDYDPNPWFNVTLYKERLWPCEGNPFVDFLKQPPLSIQKNAPRVEIFANENEFQRAWMAVEGFMRMNKFKVVLVLPVRFKNNTPICFKPMLERGLIIQYSDKKEISFYHSLFLKNPDAYHVTNLPAEKASLEDKAVTRVRRFEGYEYFMHRMYKYAKWKQKALINPCMLNFAHYCFEPIEFSPFGETEIDFKKSLQRIASGFDLMFINYDIETENLRIIPGFMKSYVNENEIPQTKTHDISFLLSLGGKGMSSFKTRGSFIYHYRKEIWDNQGKIVLPKKFYISRRDIDKFPKTFQDYVLPTDSKKWIFGSEFTIAIENTKQEHYFSEKLLGCFIALTIPIYIGCPNIRPAA